MSRPGANKLAVVTRVRQKVALEEEGKHRKVLHAKYRKCVSLGVVGESDMASAHPETDPTP